MENNFNDDVIPETNEKYEDSVVDSIPEGAKTIKADGTNTSVAVPETTQEAEPSSVMAIISLVLGIFSVVCCCSTVPAFAASVIGLILGIISIKYKYGGKPLATAGIIICSIGIALSIFSIIAGIIGSAVTGLFSLSVY